MRTFKQAAVLLGAAAAFGALAPNANAQTTLWGPTVPFSGGTTQAGATFTGVSVGGGTGGFTYASPIADTYTANLNFNPGYNTGGSTQQFKYTLAAPSTKIWIQAGLTSQMQALFEGGSFQKQICSTGFGTGTCKVFTSTDSNSSTEPTALVGFGSQIWVTDSYTSTASLPNGQITGITNTFMTAVNPVPGPLPLLGAGAAFGFSRKLRRRIKSVV
jgi:hypothetical protein